jgi:hypothetical protein
MVINQGTHSPAPFRQVCRRQAAARPTASCKRDRHHLTDLVSQVRCVSENQLTADDDFVCQVMEALLLPSTSLYKSGAVSRGRHT